jgi:hypothetical protein
VFKDRLCLIPGDAGEPLEELFQPGTGLQVLE